MPFSFKPTEDTTPPPALSAEGITSRFKESKSSLFTFLAAVIFGVSVAVSVVLFLYQQKLQGDVDEQKGKLAQYDSQLQVLPVNDMVLLSTRLKIAKRLITEHTSVDTAFRVLEESIENPVTYTQFDFKRDPARGDYSLAISAKSPDYKSIIQQQETLKNKPYSDYMPDVEFAGVGADDKGSVSFSIKSTILVRGRLPEEFVIKKAEISAQADQVGISATATQQ